jgi:hypothetical protein
VPIKLILLLSMLIGLVFAAAPPASTKGKAPAKATSTSKAKAPATTAAKTGTSTKKPGTAAKSTVAKAGSAKAPASKRTTAATTRRPAANTKAVYSRTNNSRYGRGQTAARRGSVPVRSQSTWQARPSPERYREIQQALADKGFFKGEVDGTWSTTSVTALKDFQRAQNLEPDGKLGSLSLIALGLGPKRIVAANPNPPPTPLPAATPQQQQPAGAQPSPPAQNPVQP